MRECPAYLFVVDFYLEVAVFPPGVRSELEFRKYPRLLKLYLSAVCFQQLEWCPRLTALEHRAMAEIVRLMALPDAEEWESLGKLPIAHSMAKL